MCNVLQLNLPSRIDAMAGDKSIITNMVSLLTCACSGWIPHYGFPITVNYLTGGMSGVFQQFPYLMILGDPPPSPRIHDILNSINTVVAYLVVCYAVRTVQVTARHVPCCI